MLGLIYMDRFIQRNDFALTSLNVHRVAITSVMVAAKFFDDQYYNNAYYAKVATAAARRGSPFRGVVSCFLFVCGFVVLFATLVATLTLVEKRE